MLLAPKPKGLAVPVDRRKEGVAAVTVAVLFTEFNRPIIGSCLVVCGFVVVELFDFRVVKFTNFAVVAVTLAALGGAPKNAIYNTKTRR